MSSESTLRDGNGAGFELIETLRCEPGSGLVRLERHVGRLQASARELGFRCDPDMVRAALAGSVDPERLLRVRVTLARNGDVGCASQPFEPVAPGTLWKLRIATARLDRDSPLIRHKTTRREVYQAARQEFSLDEADEVVLLNHEGELCEGTITTIFVDKGDGGPLLTPALRCGLLPGVLRAELIEEGRASEAELGTDDLMSARAVYVGNSLRGLIRAELPPLEAAS
jgi:4-amino-4-deoxychorismate lyase